MQPVITRNPATDGEIQRYDRHDGATRRGIMAAARAAQADFGRLSASDRAPLLAQLGRLLLRDKEKLARLATAEMGKPIVQARKEVEKSAAACDYYAENAARFLADEPVGKGKYVAFRPLGTILIVMPWNFPYWQVIRCAAPALAAGNAVLLKHSDNTTGCSLEIERLIHEAGVETALFRSLITDHDSLKEVIADESVRAVSLTGSERAGAAVAELAGKHLKKTVLELGGSDAYLIFDDADVEKAAQICVDARYVNSGQSCVAAKRFIATPKVFESFREAFVAKARLKRVGDPTLEATDCGPMARSDLRDGVAKQVQSSLSRGAKALVGGTTPGGPGSFYPVTVLDGVEPGMAAFDEETFGPVAALVRAKDEGDAISLANRSRYGLGGAIFSRDVAKAEKWAREELEVGFSAVNAAVVSDAKLPFGGVKLSGYGRELGPFGLREFVNVKAVTIS